jgi:hypothetical protein
MLTKNKKMEKLNLYIKELIYLKWYMFVVLMIILLSYSVYFCFNADTVANLGKEENFFEILTAVNFLIASLILLGSFFKTKNYFILLLAVLFFIGFGEELSWGQQIFKINTPEFLKEANVQKEINIHNLEIFNSREPDGEYKKGIPRLLEINFMFKVFTMLFGIALPFLVFHFKFIGNITRKLKVPVPPITIGILFLINWLVFRVLLSIILPEGFPQPFYNSSVEIFECMESTIILAISLFFYLNRSGNILGLDIKQTTII